MATSTQGCPLALDYNYKTDEGAAGPDTDREAALEHPAILRAVPPAQIRQKYKLPY